LVLNDDNNGMENKLMILKSMTKSLVQFEIGEVSVEPKDKLVKTANQVYEVEAFQCNANNVQLADADRDATRNQGAVLRVCVQPTQEGRDDGIFMRRIDSFEFTRAADEINAEVRQVAVQAGAEAPNLLTSLDCKSGYQTCSFETILFAAFYRSAGSVAGSGIASMQFGGSARRLRSGGRNAQEDDVAGAAEFELDFDIVATVDDESSDASRMGTMSMALVAIAGAVALL
jgi:hypothetical protein